METSFQPYHRNGYAGNGSDRNRNNTAMDEVEELRLLPNLITRESDLLYIADPEKLLGEFMKLRNWSYRLDMAHEGNRYKATVDIDKEDIFSQVSAIEKKALVKVVICVVYHYDSMLASIWIARHQGALKEFIR